MRKRLLSGLLVILLLVEVWTPHVYATETQPLQGEETVMTSPDPGEALSPTMTPDIDETASPEIEATASPEGSAVPEVTITPSATVEPEETSEPNATETPEALETPSEQPEESENKQLIQTATPSTSPVQKYNAGPKEEVELVTAAISRTQEEAVSWARSQLGNKLDIDGNGAWCVDLIAYYYQFFGVNTPGGNAQNYAYNDLPDGWVRYFNTDSGFSIQPGDIAVWSWNDNHIGIVESADSVGYNMIHQAPSMGEGVRINWYNNSKIYCIIRPNYTPSDGHISFDTYDDVSEITDTSAKVGVWLDNPTGKWITSIGFLYGTQQDNLQQFEVTKDVAWTRPHLSYNIGNYVSLLPNTEYCLQFYAIVDGERYCSKYIFFRTSGISFDTYNIADISDNNATVSVWMDNPTGKWITSMGFLYGMQQDNLQQVEVTTSVAWTRAYLSYSLGNYVGNLYTGSRYFYQFYAIADGKEYRSNVCDFQTTGQADMEAPIVTNAYISQHDNSGYTVTAHVSDNRGIQKVAFPTWHEGQTGEDARWFVGTKNGDGTYSYRVNINDFNNWEGKYYTHVYVWDIASNVCSEPYQLEQIVEKTPPIVSNVQVERISDDTFKISCDASDDTGIERVCFPTWTSNNGQDDIFSDWYDNCKGVEEGNRWVYYVSDFQHNYESGPYITDIYAYDMSNNYSDPKQVIYSFENRFIPISFEYDNHKYEIYNDLLTWSEAKAKCEELGGHLVTITSQGEQDAITQAISSQVRPGYLIGGMTVNGSPTWITGEKFDYTNWYPGEPNNWNGIEYVYQMYKDNGKWNDVADVKESMGFICEYEDLGDVPIEDIPAGGIPEGLWMAGLTDYTYTGKEIKPEVRVYDANRLLKKNTDYTISYANNINVNNFVKGKEPTILVKGKGNYSGEIKVTFNILPIDIGGVDFTSDNLAVVYNGKEQKVAPKLQWNGKQLKVNRDFSCEYGSTQAGAYQEVGTYVVRIHGMGNFTGTREVQLSVTENKKQIISNATVSGIKTQTYTGSEICPSLSVTLNGKKLDEGTDYRLSYEKNEQIGTAYVIVQGIGNYSGSKRVSFKITGISMNKVKVENLTSVVYTGEKIVPTCQLKYPISKTESITLKEGTDYNAVYSKNENAGTATVEFIGINGYSGKIKKTFKITPYDMETDVNNCFSFSIPDVVAYEKGGSRPEEEVYYLGRKLVRGTDYTVTYSNNTKVSADNAGEKQPVIVIKGKGNFKGTKQFTFRIGKQDIGNVKIVMNAPDKVFQNKKNNYTSKVTLKDANGKTLAAGKDYENIAYFYKNDTTLLNGTVRKAGSEATDKADVVPAGTVMTAKVNGKGNYTGTKSCEYRITKASIGSAKVTIATQSYTGSAITLSKEDIKVTMKGVPLEADEFDIVEGSYKNNVAKGTAKVTIKGKENYGGTKEVTFKIKAKLFAWWKN